MADLSAAKRARMACRVYLKLYDAGADGAPITKADVLGADDDLDGDLDDAMAVIGRFIDDTILDEPGHGGGEPHYALTAPMRDRMAASGEDGPIVDRLRADLAGAGRDGTSDDRWTRTELMIRTGHLTGEPL